MTVLRCRPVTHGGALPRGAAGALRRSAMSSRGCTGAPSPNKSHAASSAPPRVTVRRVVVSLRGPGQSPVLPFACCVGSLFLYGALDSHPFFPSHVASGRCFLSAAAAGAPAGVVSAFAEPSRWCAGGCAECGGGRLTGFAAHTPPPAGRPPPASPRFRVR